MTVKVRTKFQPRHELEVPEQEAEVLAAQGLLWEGTEDDLHELLASDPVGSLDPPYRFDKDPVQDAVPPGKPAAAKAPTGADQPPADTAKGA